MDLEKVHKKGIVKTAKNTVLQDVANAAGIDLDGDKATAVSNYIVNLVQNPNFVVDSNDGSLGLVGLKDRWFCKRIL